MLVALLSFSHSPTSLCIHKSHFRMVYVLKIETVWLSSISMPISLACQLASFICSPIPFNFTSLHSIPQHSSMNKWMSLHLDPSYLSIYLSVHRYASVSVGGLWCKIVSAFIVPKRQTQTFKHSKHSGIEPFIEWYSFGYYLASSCIIVSFRYLSLSHCRYVGSFFGFRSWLAGCLVRWFDGCLPSYVVYLCKYISVYIFVIAILLVGFGHELMAHS